MASEFTRKIQRIKDILTFNSILADDGDILLTKSGEVYTQVNGKVKQLSNPNYGAGNVNKILAVSGTGEVAPIVMPLPNLGKENAGKSVIVGDDGFITVKTDPVTPPASSASSEAPAPASSSSSDASSPASSATPDAGK